MALDSPSDGNPLGPLTERRQPGNQTHQATSEAMHQEDVGLLGVFKSSILEEEYRRQQLKHDAPQTRKLLIICLTGSVVFSFSDYHLFGMTRQFFLLLGVRVLLTLSCLPALVVSKGGTPRRVDRTLFAWSLVLAAGVTYISMTRPGNYTPYTLVNSLVIIALYSALPVPLIRQAVPALLLSMGSLFVFLRAEVPNAAMARTTILTCFFFANALGITVSRRLNGWKRRQWLALSREIRVRAALETSNDFIALLDLKGTLLYINPGGCRHLGIDDSSSLIGGEWASMHPEADRPNARQAIANARAGCTGRMVAGCRSWSGEDKWWDSVITPIASPSGQVENLLVISRDITAAKQGEEDLRVALEQVRSLKDQLDHENAYLQDEIRFEHNSEEILGQSDVIKRVFQRIEQVAPLDTTVLILGETGTGKELVARSIHSLSARKHRPLVKINCAALPPTLIESEFFGHEKGAFTDARFRKLGRFELASGGTIFLDEIGELPLDLQAKLLRVLQEGEFERLGSSTTITVDTRILAASNRDLKTEVEEGRFREDLWYRLSVFPIVVPPLRERKEDIPVLVSAFVSRLGKKLGKPVKTLHGLNTLQNYAWPGNIRELANVVERAMIEGRGGTLHFAELDGGEADDTPRTQRSLEDLEREFIIATLQRTGGRIEGREGAARALGLNPSTLRTRMKKLAIQRRSSSQITTR